ncbi:MAG: hypothetical protein JO171_12200 [Paludibacterium sp.]|uniref:hypothetical protein n=1 Tax=Paludibacterium sp. TaxID=1917523 RepID=UPI0025FCCEA6|nr:hypothetical protein [Paludibacterium sp.]MBV8047913.1 hypothetical protein [Paludibacterium sp.]MBV8647665.1 hypothetical protein [Paludibacterium sp.]
MAYCLDDDTQLVLSLLPAEEKRLDREEWFKPRANRGKRLYVIFEKNDGNDAPFTGHYQLHDPTLDQWLPRQTLRAPGRARMLHLPLARDWHITNLTPDSTLYVFLHHPASSNR